MAINDEIAAGGRPIQFENPLNNMVKMFNIRNDMQTNQMNQMKMDEANRVHGADIAFKNALRGIRDPNSPEGQLETDRVYFDAGFGDKRAAMRASEEASRKAYNEEQKQLEEEGYAAHREISSDPSDERIAERNRQVQNDIRFSAAKKALAADNAGRLINMPYEQRKIEMAQAGATVAERKPSIIQQNTGSHANVLAVPAFGGATTTLSSTLMGLTPEQQLGVRVGYTEGSASLDARNKSLNAKLAELNAPGTTPERAKALEGEIQQDRRSISAQQEDQESIRRADQQAKQLLDAKDRRVKDYYADIAKGRSPQDPEMKDRMAQIIHDRTHANQIRPPIDPRVVTHVTVKEDGTLVNQNALGEVVSTIKDGGKPSAQYSKAKEQAKTLNRNVDIAIKQIGDAIKPGGLLDRSTGSGIGRGVDIGANLIGKATPGAIAAAELAPIADLAVKLVTRFEGNQSNADVVDYKTAAGQLADPTLPIEIRRAAAVKVMDIMKRRKGQFITPEMAAQGEAPQGSPPPPAGFVAD